MTDEFEELCPCKGCPSMTGVPAVPKPNHLKVKLERVSFFAPDSDVPQSLKVEDKGGVLELQHDYPDFRPGPGWTVEIDGERREIFHVDGRRTVLK